MTNKINTSDYKTRPHYFLRRQGKYQTIPEAQKALNNLNNPNLQIGYYKPQPQYKSWVPKFIIRLITK